MFFALGENNFLRLPVLTPTVNELVGFKTSEGESVSFRDYITVLGFFGKNLLENKGNAFNLAHKIYKKYHEFQDFQMVFLLPEGSQEQSKELKAELSEIADTTKWKFVFGPSEEIQKVFNSLESNYILDAKLASPYVFIIDKDGSLRGRDDDDGLLYGFDATNIGEINNKMDVDIKALLAEYRLALKKYKANRDL